MSGPRDPKLLLRETVCSPSQKAVARRERSGHRPCDSATATRRRFPADQLVLRAMVGPTVVRATVVGATVVGATVVRATVIGPTVVRPTVAITGRIGSIGGCGRIGIGRTFGRFSSRCCGSIGRAGISG